jgi:hypothetical protein
LSTIGTRFLLLLFMNYFFTVEKVSVYYLLANALFFIGYLSNSEFGTITTREYFSSGTKKDAFSAHFLHLLMSGMLGCLIVIGYMEFLKLPDLIFYCVFLFILDYLNKDLERWLVLHTLPIQSAISLFLRSSAWVYLLIPYAYIYDQRNLEQFYAAAIAFNIFALALNLKNCNFFFSSNKLIWVGFPYIWSLIKKVIPVFIATILIKLLFTLDKNVLDFFSEDKVELASYLFFFSFAYMILTFVEIFIFSFDFPKILVAYKQGKLNALSIHSKIMKKVCLLAFTSCIFISFFSYFAIYLIDRGEYFSFYPVSILLNLSVVFFSIYQGYRYWFYVAQKDNVNLFNTVFVFVLFCFVLFSIKYSFAWVSTPVIISFSLLIAMFFGVLLYTVLYLKLNRSSS